MYNAEEYEPFKAKLAELEGEIIESAPEETEEEIENNEE